MNQFLKLMLLLTLLSIGSAQAKNRVYLTQEQFLDRVFSPPLPAPKLLWLQGALKEQASVILGHRYKSLRVRYWQQKDLSAWILEEIGKDQAITVGVVVKNAQLLSVDILTFRESRGDEVRYPAFTRQFVGARLESNLRLDTAIDGITGATLSVRAVTKVARLALLFSAQQVKKLAEEAP